MHHDNLIRTAELFERAISLDAAAREAFLADACRDHPELLLTLKQMLQAHDRQGSFLADGESVPSIAKTCPPPSGGAPDRQIAQSEISNAEFPESQISNSQVSSAPDARPHPYGRDSVSTDRLPTTAIPLTEKAGSRIGPYKLLQQIGEGGFGAVFMAEQERPVRRRVALKIIKLGMDTRAVIARFEAERQALAMMDHPHIARVLDAGATDSGRPYFVMELVKGDPITRYCDEHKLPIRDRLELFAQVCNAVQHAHQKGVIHRDIKPGNVLVCTQDGRPHARVIDFGIAKATDHRLTEKTLFTEFHQMIGTPAYMSPEQAGGSPDIDTRTDICSLGVLLYELLTGSPPFDPERLHSAAYEEMRRIIREDEPPKPSTRINSLALSPQNRAAPVRKRSPLERVVACELDNTPNLASGEGLHTPSAETNAGPALAPPPLPHGRGSVDDPIAKTCLAFGGSPNHQIAKSPLSLADLAQRRNTDPKKLSLLLRGELDWIVMKALDKNRARRYDTANALALDIARHLSGEPIVAAPPSTAYRMKKFVRKHRGPVIASFAVGMALLLGMATTTWQWRIASIERSRADDKAREAESSRAAAESSREAETTAKNAALRAKVEAERESYVANIVAAHASFVSNEASSIRARLDACSSQYRGWEWNYLNAQSDNCLFVIGDLKVRVRAAAFSPDGRQIVTGMSDGTARVWNATTGSELLVLRGHSDSIESVVFSADGKRIITTASDAAIAWDSVNGDEQLVIHSQGSIGTAEFSADGRHIVGQRSRADDLSEIVIWNAVTGDELAALDGLYKAVSPDGARLLTMDREAAQLWDMNGTELWRLEGGSLYEATFSADGEHLVIVTSGNPLIVDAATGKERALLSNGTLSVAISPDSRHLLTGKLDETATIWDMDGKELLSLHGHSHWVESGQFSPDGRKIVTASRDRTARVWDATDGRELAVLRGHREDLDLAVFSSNAARIMTLSRGDGTVRVWDGDTHEIRSNASNLMSAIFSPDGTRIVTASLDYPLEIWNAASGIKLGTLGSEEDGRSRELVAAGYHPDGTRIVTSAWDGAPRLWDATLGKELAEFPVRQASTPHSSVSNGVVAFSPDGDLFVATSIEQFPVRFELSVRDSVTGREVVALHEQEPGFLGAAFDPSGPRIVTASGDPTARTWNVETGDELMRLSGHEKGVSTCAYSLDGTRIVTASSDNTARVWHSESGNELLTLRGHQDRLQAVAFSPDGARIVTSAYDQTVRLWDAATGRELLTLRDNAEVVRTVAFSPDGTRIVTASQHGAVRVLDSVPYRQRFAELDTLYKARAPAERLLDLLMTGNSEPEEVVATIQRNPDLSEPVRRVALDMILERNLNFEDEARKRLSALYAAHGTQPRVTAAIERDDLMPPMMKSEIRRLMLVRPRSATGLNAWAWRLVADQAIATEKIGMALEAAEQAAHLSPEDPAIMNTLGVAFYRHGDYAEAIVELEKSERQFAFAKNSESPSTTPQHPANWAFIAMSHFQLGHADEARAALEKLRALMREEGHADDEESQQFLREAEALIEGRTTSSELLATSQPTTTNPATE